MTGGGQPLNFDVKAYATEALMDADTPKANTIGVITTTAITGWHLSATQPENMANGEVWFPVGTSSPVEFNALKKNGIQVYPLSAKQMVSGTLKDVIAKSYIDGEWKSWITVLWDASKNYENLKVLGNKGFYITKQNTSGGTISKSASGLVINSHKNDNTISVSHDNSINFDNISKVTVTWDGGNDYQNYQGIGVYRSNNMFRAEEAIAHLHKDNTIYETVSLDVSMITGDAYVTLIAYNGDLTVYDLDFN